MSKDFLEGIKRLEEQKEKDQEKIAKKQTAVTSNIENPVKSNIVNMDTSKQGYIRQTYHVTDVHIKALDLFKAYEGIDKSEIVREALDNIIPAKYITMAKEVLNK